MATPLRGCAPLALPAAIDTGSERGPAPDQLALSAGAAALPMGQYEQKLQTARAAVAQDPKRVAQVVKTWIGQEGA